MTGVAVKVTEVPAQTVPEGFTTIETLAGMLELMVIVMELEIAGLPVAQVKFDVSVQLIKSPFVGI